MLVLNFRNGYVPNQGDTFTLLAAAGSVSDAFDEVEISGLPPGFQYELTVENGQVSLEALSGGAPAGRMFLPLMMRRR